MVKLELTQDELRVLLFCLLNSDHDIPEFFDDTSAYHSVAAKCTELRREYMLNHHRVGESGKKFQPVQLELDLN